MIRVAPEKGGSSEQLSDDGDDRLSTARERTREPTDVSPRPTHSLSFPTELIHKYHAGQWPVKTSAKLKKTAVNATTMCGPLAMCSRDQGLICPKLAGLRFFTIQHRWTTYERQ